MLPSSTQNSSLLQLFSQYEGEPVEALQPVLMAQAAPRAITPNVTVPAAPAAAPTAPREVPISAAGKLDLLGLLNRYQPAETSYSSDLAQARSKVNQEATAFETLISDALRNQETAPSKAEMYFRLASAFGAPTRTGAFSETLGNVAKEASAYGKEEREARRAEQALKLQTALKSQEYKLQAAKENLTTLRTLAAEEMKDKRTIATELIKDYVKSGQPQSSAGKQAQDEGLQPGTQAFQKRVAEIAEADIDKKMAQVNSTLANMSVAQANLALNQAKFENQKTQQAKLSPAEVKLKTDAEDQVASADAAMKALERAYRLNPNTFDTSLADVAQRKILEAAGSKDVKLRTTREMENLLAQEALGKLRATFGGNPTEGERKILLDLEGIGAKSIEERANIMKNTFRILRDARTRHVKRLNEINAGLYRDTQAPVKLEGEE